VVAGHRIKLAVSRRAEDQNQQSVDLSSPYVAFFRTRLADPPTIFGLVIFRVLYGDNSPGDDRLNQLSRVTDWLNCSRCGGEKLALGAP
jgi:hypothetical protein